MRTPLVCPDCEPLIAKLEARIAELERRLAVYENPNTPPSQQRFPQRKTRDQPPKPLGRPPGFEGCTRPTPKPDKTVVALEDHCSKCGSKLGEPTGFQTILVEEIPKPQPVQVTEFKLAEYRCRNCGETTTATHPDCPQEGVFGPRAMAQIALLKYSGRLPCKLVCTALQRDYGLQITPATVLAVNSRITRVLEEDYARIVERIRRARVLHIDETGFRVAGVNNWLWIFTTETETLVVIRPSRAMKVLREMLGETFDGVIVCDGHKAYTNYANNIQRCWAHLLRQAEFAREKTAEAKPFYEALRALYWRLVEALESNPSMEERLRLWRNAMQVLRYWLGKKWVEKESLKAVGYLRNGLKHWLTFVLVVGVEPTNNRAERALREHVVLRKIIGGLRSGGGVRQHEVITSVLATWHQRETGRGSNLRERLTNTLRES